jgi:hypothetical protein
MGPLPLAHTIDTDAGVVPSAGVPKDLTTRGPRAGEIRH